MREIKFRAWDINHKKWYTRVQIGTNCCHAVYDEEREMWLEFDELCGTVVQFTGLHDRNGKEIYEGDVVRYEERIAKVFFSDHNGAFQVNFLDSDHHMFMYPQSFEVIGNIYEHSDLLQHQEVVREC